MIIFKHLLGPVHTYPDIFESATFSFQIQKYFHPLVAYSNRIDLMGLTEFVFIYQNYLKITLLVF